MNPPPHFSNQDSYFASSSRPSLTVPELIGANGPTLHLLNFLMDMGMPQLKVLSIVGFAGIGKTALASQVYGSLREQFECSAFVSVSKWPDTGRILRDILHEVGPPTHCSDIGRMDNSELAYQIQQHLKDKRYIILLDDIWDTQAWRIIKGALPDDNCGSKLIATTRLNDVAKACCPGHHDWIYELKPLTYLNSKKLFLKGVWGSESICPDTFAEISHEILKMCGGVPLALVSVSTLLAKKVLIGKEYQNNIIDSLRSDIPKKLTDSIFLSCSGPPYALEACSMYLSIIPVEHKIERRSFVRKWIAEGFIAEETVANEYFDELINRNVIHLVEYDSSCQEEAYQVHPFMLEVLKKISVERNFATSIASDNGGVIQLTKNARRLCLHSYGSGHLDCQLQLEMPRTRSVNVFGNSYPFFNLYLDMPYLQVLDLDGCKDLDNSAMDHICRMILLKYLSLKQTQVSVIPPQIANMQCLETLAIRKTQITTLPAQTGELQNLKTLDIRHTEISSVPPEIGKMENLEILDVRQTRVEQLPREVVQLPKLAHFLFSQSGSLGGVKLTVGSYQLNSVRVMATVGSRECSESAMEEISRLPEVTEIAVLLYDGPADKERNDKLLSCVAKCGNLQTLIIYGDSDPSVELPPAPPNLFPLLEKLVVAGRFVKVPRWIAQLGALKKLDIRVCKLEPDHLGILGALPGLTTLALAMVCIPRKKQVAITGSPECFSKLEVFSFDCRVPWITFEQSSMPRLKHLHLKLYACAAAGKFPSGITHLGSLKKIVIRYSSEYENSSGVTEAVDAMRQEAAKHGNFIELSVNGDYEVFLSNTTLDKKITGSEIEECY